MSIENPTLAHFRHFSSLFTLSLLYICREPSTNQLLFMQNKPNSLNVQIYINIYDTKDYKNFIPLAGYKNKPNSNPIKPNLVRRRRIPKSQNECKLTYNKGLQKKRCFRSPNKQTQFPKWPK